MPVTLSDASIKSAYKSLERSLGNKAATVDDLKKILAAVADRAGLTGTSAKTQLDKAVSKQEMLSIVKEGLSAREKKDVEAMLDATGTDAIKLGSDARKFLEQLVGRAPVNPTNGPVNITDMKVVGGKVEISGTSAPNVTVEAINLSTIPSKRLHDDNTFVLATTDASGKLQGKTDLQAGDWLRIRTRDASGKLSDWMVVRADQLGVDKRAAEIGLFRVELSDAGNGKINVANNNNSRPISEPFAKLQFTNDRTGEKTIIDMDDTGRFPGVPKLNGKPGDTFSVAATDGRVNANFRDKAGTVEVPGANSGGGTGAQIDDPLPHKDDRKPDGTSRYDLKRHTGPLFVGGVDPGDVKQGNIGDCYVPAAAAALAHSMPDLMRTLIKDDGTGKFTFNFKEVDWNTGRATSKKIDVDADFYVRSYGGPLYGASSNSTDPKKMELWWPLFEKAYAKLQGDFQNIGEGGSSADVFEAATGRPGLTEDFSARNKDAMWKLMKDKLAKNLPVCMGTKDDHNGGGAFANAGVFGDHTYSVFDAFEKNGVKYVTVRNPWGESEPYPGDGKDDGVFTLKLDDMPKWFSVVWSVE
jgi:hypothetical protein